MSGYVEVGYVVVLGSIAGYALSLVSRERAARRRLPAYLPSEAPAHGGLVDGGPAHHGPPEDWPPEDWPPEDRPPEDRPPATAAHGEPS